MQWLNQLYDDVGYLTLFRHDLVMQHFPRDKLVENPGVWAVMPYK